MTHCLFRHQRPWFHRAGRLRLGSPAPLPKGLARTLSSLCHSTSALKWHLFFWYTVPFPSRGLPRRKLITGSQVRPVSTWPAWFLPWPDQALRAWPVCLGFKGPPRSFLLPSDPHQPSSCLPSWTGPGPDGTCLATGQGLGLTQRKSQGLSGPQRER